MTHKIPDRREKEIEKYRFELAEELGLIEQAGGNKRSRANVMKHKRTPHAHPKKRDQTGL